MAKENIIHLGNNGLSLIQTENGSGNKIKINEYRYIPFEEGTIINGVITNIDNAREALTDIKKIGAKSATLVVDSGKEARKICVVPSTKTKNIERICANEIKLLNEEFENPIYDYIYIDSAKTGGNKILLSVIEKEFIQTYVELFEEVGIKLNRIDMSTNALIKLTENTKEFSKKNYAIVLVDGNGVSSLIFNDNKFVFRNFSRITAMPKTDAYIDELVALIIQLRQFNQTQYIEKEIEAVYFGGLDDFEEEALFPIIKETLNIKAQRYEFNKNIVLSKKLTNFAIHRNLIAIGSSVKR